MAERVECPKCLNKTAHAHCAAEHCDWLVCRYCKGTMQPSRSRGFTATGPFTLPDS